MNPRWRVVLLQNPKTNDFQTGFFPRKFYYKKDAMQLVEEIKQKQGVAVLEKWYNGGWKTT